MNLEPNAFQTEIADTAAAFLADRLPISRLRQIAKAESRALPDADWQACADMGWTALLLPEESGGLGLGMADAVMVFREIGRHLTPGPLRSGALAALVAGQAGNLALAAELAGGTRRAGLAFGESGGIRAIDAQAGDVLLAVEPEGARLLEVTASDAVSGIDTGVRLAVVPTGMTLAEVADPAVLTRLRLLAAAELLGVIEAVRDMSAEYAKIRVQFGRPIGTFQAVKHRCAEMMIKGYAVRAQLFMAAVRFDSGMADAGFQAANAYVLACDSARRSCADNIQNHGGIGMTMEQDANLYLKRALLLENLCGPRRTSHQAIMAPDRHEFV
jgi:alkylation response protein AidB-like acyl-CoA dehydrogenase